MEIESVLPELSGGELHKEIHSCREMCEFSSHVAHEGIMKGIIKVPLQNWSLKTEVNQVFDWFEMLKKGGFLSAIWGVLFGFLVWGFFFLMFSSCIITENLLKKKQQQKKEELHQFDLNDPTQD